MAQTAACAKGTQHGGLLQCAWESVRWRDRGAEQQDMGNKPHHCPYWPCNDHRRNRSRLHVLSQRAVTAVSPHDTGAVRSRGRAHKGRMGSPRRQSATGLRSVCGSYASVHTILCMTTATITCHNPDVRTLYTRLYRRGKPGKVVPVAVMRTLFLIVSAVIRNPIPSQRVSCLQPSFVGCRHSC